MQNKQFNRVFSLMQILLKNRFHATLEELSESLEDMGIEIPSTRTLFRDIRLLTDHGFTISTKKKEGYLLENRERSASLPFTDDMVQAIQTSRGLFNYFDGTTLKETLDETVALVTGATRSDLSKGRFAELENNIMVHLGTHRHLGEKRDVIDELISSINGDYVTEIWYRKPNNENVEKVTVYPYRLILYKDTLYLLAEKEDDNSKLRIYHISRTSQAEQLEKSFKRKARLITDFEKKLSYSFGILTMGERGDVKITFSKYVKESIYERIWHNSQRIVGDGDEVTLKMDVLINAELARWILSWGKEVIDIKPDSLNELVAKMRG